MSDRRNRLRAVRVLFLVPFRLCAWVMRKTLRCLKLAVLAPVGLVLQMFYRRSGEVFLLDLRHGLHGEQPSLNFLQARRSLSLFETLRAGRIAREDRRCALVLLLLDSFNEPVAKVEILREMLREFHRDGREIWALANSYSRSAYLLASMADKVLIGPAGSLELGGISLGAFFVRELLSTVGVEAELEHIGDYKSFSETFTHDDFSPPHKEMLTDLGESLYQRMISDVSRGRELTFEAARQRVDFGPYLPHEAVEAGLVDEIRFADQVDDLLKKRFGGEVSKVAPGEYLRSSFSKRWFESRRRPPPLLACVPLEGGIADHDPGRGEVIVPSRVLPLLEKLAETDRILGVVLWIDSPGGSAEASDLIWRGVQRLDERKPVVACLGPVAASGGYYIASAARRIFAQATTLTGSIGVVAGKINGKQLLDSLGVRRAEICFGDFAGMGSPFRPFQERERKKLLHGMQSCYDLFVSRVASGRRLKVTTVEKVAQGRVWTGEQARRLGLVDALGGPEAALGAVAELSAFPSEGGEIHLFSPLRLRLPLGLPMIPGLRAFFRERKTMEELTGLFGSLAGRSGANRWVESLDLLLRGRARPLALAPFWLGEM